MQKQILPKKHDTPSRPSRFRPLWLLAAALLLFVICGAYLTFALRSEASTASTSVQTTHVALPTQKPEQSSVITPTATQGNSNKQKMPLQPVRTPVATVSTIHTTPTVSVTPTLIASTPQSTQYGVFPLSSGGPLPVPESVLRPTNIARVMLNSALISVYAGSMAKNAQAGILCVLREDITTGEMHIQVYQGPQTGGALTILAVQKNVLSIKNMSMQGTFDLNTNTFHW